MYYRQQKGVMDNNSWQNEMTCRAREEEGEPKKREKAAWEKG